MQTEKKRNSESGRAKVETGEKNGEEKRVSHIVSFLAQACDPAKETNFVVLLVSSAQELSFGYS